jgi:hypothetical protein
MFLCLLVAFGWLPKWATVTRLAVFMKQRLRQGEFLRA